MSTFIKDTITTTLSKIIIMFLGMLSSVLLARILGPEGKGVLSMALLLPSFLVMFTDLGIPIATTYYTACLDFSTSEIFGNTIILGLLVTVGSSLIGLIIAIFFSNHLFPGIPKGYLLLALCTIPFTLISTNLDHIFLGLQRISELNILNIIKKSLFLIFLIFFIIILKKNVIGAIFSQILGDIFFFFIIFFVLLSAVGGISMRPNQSYLKKASTYGLKAHLSSIFSFLNYRADIFMVNWFLNPIAVGFYSIAVGLVEQLWLVSYAANLILFPRVVAEKDETQRREFTSVVCRTILWLTISGAIFFYFIAPWLIILLYSAKFTQSIVPFRILLLGIVTLTVWRTLANDIAGRGHPGLNIPINFLAFITNIFFNILWIPKLGINGAAWATVVSYTTACICIIVMYCNITGNLFTKLILPQPSDWQLCKSIIIRFCR